MKELIIKILNSEDITSTQKLMLITLTSIEASKGASLTDITFYTSLTRKTVITTLNALEDANLIEVVRDSTRVNKYIVRV